MVEDIGAPVAEHEPVIDPAKDSGSATTPVPLPSAEDLLRDAKTVEEKKPYRDRKNDQRLQQRSDEHDLRKTVAGWVYIATAVQVLIADVLFYLYASLGRDWNVPTAAISTWLGATVVQVIAVLLVITRYLFPGRRRKP